MIGGILIVTGGAIFGLGFFSYREVLRKLAAEGVRGMSIWTIGIPTFGPRFSAVLSLLLIFVERGVSPTHTLTPRPSLPPAGEGE